MDISLPNNISKFRSWALETACHPYGKFTERDGYSMGTGVAMRIIGRSRNTSEYNASNIYFW